MSIKVAVIGAGSMGQNHVRIYSELPDVELVGVADPNEIQIQKVTRRYGGKPYTDYRHMLEEQHPDAISIAVPTMDHAEIALHAIDNGIHILIEKPIAYTLEEAEQIISAAKKNNIKLMVGHIERFNPAIIQLKQRLAKSELGRTFQIDVHRQGPFPARIRDVGVVIDLAVHDLDIMRYITNAEVTRLYAETERRIHSSHEDLLSGLVRLDDGTVGNLTINWLTPMKTREITVTGEGGMFRVDYITQDLYFFENATAVGSEWDAVRMLRGVSEGPMTRYIVEKKEPLRVELEAFVDSILKDTTPLVTGEDGLKALALAQAVVTSGLEHRIIFF